MAANARRPGRHHVTATPPPARPRLSPIRTFLVVIGVLVMLFSGGCSLLLMSDAWEIWPLTLIFGGVPFALALLRHDRSASFRDRPDAAVTR